MQIRIMEDSRRCDLGLWVEELSQWSCFRRCARTPLIDDGYPIKSDDQRNPALCSLTGREAPRPSSAGLRRLWALDICHGGN
jgi:hypothetical protein